MTEGRDKLGSFAVERLASTDRYEVVMLVGDGTYNGLFWPKEEIERAARTMVGRPVNLDHSEKLEDVVGVVVSAYYSAGALRGVVELQSERPRYALAKSHIEGTLSAGATPNVSIEAFRKIVDEQVNGNVRLTARNLDFLALALVSVGACDDKKGCGVKPGLFSHNKAGAKMPDNGTPEGASTKETLCAKCTDTVSLRAENETLKSKLAEVTKERDVLHAEKERAPVLAEIAKLAPDYKAPEGATKEVLSAVLAGMKLAADTASKLAADTKAGSGAASGRKSALAATETKTELAAMAERTRAAMGLAQKA